MERLKLAAKSFRSSHLINPEIQLNKKEVFALWPEIEIRFFFLGKDLRAQARSSKEVLEFSFYEETSELIEFVEKNVPKKSSPIDIPLKKS